MRKKLTRTQEIINFVYNNGPCTWTDIQKFITGCDSPLKIYSSTMRGWGCSGIWLCAKRPARGRHYYICNKMDAYMTMENGDKKRRYVVIDSRTMNVKLKKEPV